MPLRLPDPATRRLLARMVRWTLVAGALSAVVGTLLAVVDVRRVPLLTHASHVPILADPNLTRRLAEADTTGRVDVLIVGSSHAFRQIDPRAFARRGLRAFNLGSSAQTPMLTAALLDRYMARMQPRLVLVETYPVTLDGDGFEGFCGLVASAPIDAMALRLALQIRTPSAGLALLGGGARRALRRPTARADGRYVAAGFVERADTVTDLRRALRRFPTSVHLDASDLTALTALARRVRGSHARVAFVQMPVTQTLRRYVAGYDAATGAVRSEAVRLGVPFVDLGRAPLGLDDRTHFYDPDHLNAAGNARVNPALLDSLTGRGLLPPATQ